MEDYPEELRTPPVSLICLTGCAELHHVISSFLHSEQPPLNTLALPDFSKCSLLSRKVKSDTDPLSAPQVNVTAPAGILKRDWLLKHRTRVPAVVAAMFRAEMIAGDPKHWLQACTDLENLKSSLQGRSTRLVVILVQTQAGEEPSEDMIIALRKRAEIDAKHLLLFNQNEAFESGLSLNRLASLFAELCLTYYKEEGRRIRSGIEKKSFPFPELNIRYCFKVAIYAEFRRDWAEALKFYEEGYRVLHQMINSPTNRPLQKLIEIKTISEYLHFKISTLLLHGGKIPEAIARFRKHIKSYKRLVGTPEADFLHWDWYSRQFLVFAELLETSIGSGPNEKLTLTEWEFQPAYYYQMAADYMREKRICLERSSESKLELSNKAIDTPESVMPSIYVGQSARLFEEGDSVTVLPLSDAEYVAYSLAEAERFQDSYEIIALYRKAHELFTSRGSTRFANQCNIGMAKEYHASEDFTNAKQLFDSVATLYRNEGWPVLLFEILGFLRDCARKLGLCQEFVAYSLEMCALPLGKNMLSKREEIQREIMQLNEGEIRVEIDLISPLRTVFNACVAFHEEKVKPGGAASLTVSILTQLPSRVKVDSLQVEFNKEECNFVVSESTEVLPNKWVRLTREIIPGQSGKLECLSVTAKIGKNITISCRAESTCSTEESQMWKFEIPPESSPAGDPILSFCGQKIIQVEEPDSSVDLILCSAGPALVGEIFQIPVKVISNNHLIKSGELKINLVDARGGGLLMSPRETETDEIETHHVELLSISGLKEDEKSDDPSDPFGEVAESETGENIKKIQYSFGVVSVPELKRNESWSCNLEVKWHRAKTVMLYVSLGYLGNTDQRVNIHKSLQIEGKIPVIISHKYMTAFRKEPLLISNIRSLTPPIEDLKDTLALNEDNILVVNAKNCTEVPLKLVELTVDLENGEKSSEFFSVREISGISDSHTTFVPGEEFRALFSVIPLVPNPNLSIGTVCLKWTRENLESAQTVVTNHSLPRVTIEEPPLVAIIECPPFATLATPFSLYVKIKNKTNLLQEIKYNLGDSQNFVFCGGHIDSFSVLPKNEHVLSYKFVPLASGVQILPKITVLSLRYSAQFNPSVASSTIFVYPSEPKLGLEENKVEILA